MDIERTNGSSIKPADRSSARDIIFDPSSNFVEGHTENPMPLVLEATVGMDGMVGAFDSPHGKAAKFKTGCPGWLWG